MKKSLKKTITKAVLGLTLAGIGVPAGAAINQQINHEQLTVHADDLAHWQYEYRTIRQGVRFLRQRRLVLKHWSKNVGWVYLQLQPWRTY